MKEIIERVETFFSELGYSMIDVEETGELYQASFSMDDEVEGSIFIESTGTFLELAYSYTFDVDEEGFLKEHLESMMNICYEYGCYFNIIKGNDEINFSVFSKLYFSGLNVESLQETLEDFISCNHEIMEAFSGDDGFGDSGGDVDDLDRQ
jgi:hypothetical protein